MNLRKKIIMLLVHMITNPNSSKGLILRAESLEKKAEKIDGEKREKMLLYARCFRELSLKNLTIFENKQFINNNLWRLK
ncbi:hypothetical protein ES702_01434 [subsurface metagenome]